MRYSPARRIAAGFRRVAPVIRRRLLAGGLSLAGAAAAEEGGSIAADPGKFEREPDHGIGGGASEEEAETRALSEYERGCALVVSDRNRCPVSPVPIHGRNRCGPAERRRCRGDTARQRPAMDFPGELRSGRV